MWIYEVSLEVEAAIAAEYSQFLEHHIPEVVGAGGFSSARRYRIADPSPDAPVVCWVVHYLARDEASIERYVAQHAPRLRADAISRFGGRFSAKRRVLEELPEATLAVSVPSTD